MARIFVTGMTASQASRLSHERSDSFSRQIIHVLRTHGHDVTVGPPLGIDQQEDYDLVLMGVAPILGLASNHAFSVLEYYAERMWDTKIYFFIDAPLPGQITASITALTKHPEQLTKKLFENRPGFPRTSQHIDLLLSAVDYMGKAWPTTFVPVFPWSDLTDIRTALPDPNLRLVGLNLDTHADSAVPVKPGGERFDIWVSNDPRSKWTQKALINMSFGVTQIKPSRFADDIAVMNRMSRVTGTLLSPGRDHTTWWTPRLRQSLSVGTPVAAEWREVGVISRDWMILPGAIEDMTLTERHGLAARQMSSYLDSIPSMQESAQQLTDTLEI